MDKKQDEVIVIDNGDNDDVPGVFIKDDPVDRFSVSREDLSLGKKWLIRTLAVSRLVEILLFLGKKWLIRMEIFNHPTRGRH